MITSLQPTIHTHTHIHIFITTNRMYDSAHHNDHEQTNMIHEMDSHSNHHTHTHNSTSSITSYKSIGGLFRNDCEHVLFVDIKVNRQQLLWSCTVVTCMWTGTVLIVYRSTWQHWPPSSKYQTTDTQSCSMSHTTIVSINDWINPDTRCTCITMQLGWHPNSRCILRCDTNIRNVVHQRRHTPHKRHQSTQHHCSQWSASYITKYSGIVTNHTYVSSHTHDEQRSYSVGDRWRGVWFEVIMAHCRWWIRATTISRYELQQLVDTS